MSAVSVRVFLFLIHLFCVVAASLSAVPAYSAELTDPFPGKEAPNPSREGVGTHMLRTLTLLDAPRYHDNFDHFDYVNPDALKRGTFRTAEVGTFHNLTPFIIQESSVQIWLVYSSFSHRLAMTRFHLIH